MRRRSTLRILCKLFPHRPGPDVTRRKLGEQESVCTRCGRDIYRLGGGRWKVRPLLGLPFFFLKPRLPHGRRADLLSPPDEFDAEAFASGRFVRSAQRIFWRLKSQLGLNGGAEDSEETDRFSFSRRLNSDEERGLQRKGSPGTKGGDD